MYIHSWERRLTLHQLQVAADVIRSCPAEHPLQLVANQKAPVLTVRNYSKLMELWQVGLVLFSSCSLQASYQDESTWELQTLLWRRNRPVHLCKCYHTSSFKLTVSLYYLTLLFFTPHCIFEFCLSKISGCVSSVFPWSIQCNVHNINLGIQISIVYSYSQNK